MAHLVPTHGNTVQVPFAAAGGRMGHSRSLNAAHCRLVPGTMSTLPVVPLADELVMVGSLHSSKAPG